MAHPVYNLRLTINENPFQVNVSNHETFTMNSVAPR